MLLNRRTFVVAGLIDFGHGKWGKDKVLKYTDEGQFTIVNISDDQAKGMKK